MCLRDHNSNNCTHSGNVCYCLYMVNNDYDKFRSFPRLYMALFRHRTCTYLHGRADRFLVSVSNGQVAALSDWAIINRLSYNQSTKSGIAPHFATYYSWFATQHRFCIAKFATQNNSTNESTTRHSSLGRCQTAS